MNDLLLVQYLHPDDGEPRAGVSTAGAVRVLPPHWPAAMLDVLDRWAEFGPALQTLDLDTLPVMQGARLVAPITFPRKVLCAGANYFSHADEMGTARPDPHAAPFFFLKPPTTTVLGPGAVCPLPAGADPRYDWEGELVVVIGRRARRVSPADARAHVAGYTVANDLSARGRFTRPDAVFPPFAYDWLGHKGQDGSCPIGPGIAPAWALPDIHASRLTLRLNGELQQDTLLAELVIGIDELVAAASSQTTLEPGDLILTGTPAGVGMPRNRFLAAGDSIEVCIEGIGVLRHTIGLPV